MPQARSWIIPAPADAPPDQQGLTLAVFTPEGVMPDDFWGRAEAREWAVQPVGVPTSLTDKFAMEPLEGEAAYLYSHATHGTLYKTLIGPRHLGGLLAWFQSTPTTVVVGLGLHRFTFVLDPAPGQYPKVRTDVYRGGSLGWQPSARPGQAMWLFLYWHGWGELNFVLPTLLGHGQELLATHGLDRLQMRYASPEVFCVAPERLALVKRGQLPLPVLGSSGMEIAPYAPAVAALKSWLSKAWLGASRQHPGLAGSRSWLALYTPIRLNSHCQRFAEDAWVREMGRAGAARFRDPRLLTDKAMMLSDSERNDPRQWLGDWFDKGMWRADEIIMPSVPAARWWLGLDPKSVTRLCEACSPTLHWGALAVSTICHVASRLGRIRITAGSASMLSIIPAQFWLAYWMVCEPHLWKKLEEESWENRAYPPKKSLESFFGIMNEARQLAFTNPQAVKNLGWLVRVVLKDVPVCDQIAAKSEEGSSVARQVWDWLWDYKNDFELARTTLEQASRSWTWDTLKSKHQRWQDNRNFSLALQLESASAHDKPWQSALGNVKWGAYEITPVRTRNALFQAGERYLNCLRVEKQLDQSVKNAWANTRRWFVLNEGKASALLEIQANKPGLWRVSQLTGPANRPVGKEFKSVGERVAQVYSMVESVDLSAPLRDGVVRSEGKVEDSVSAQPSSSPKLQTKKVSGELLEWLEVRSGPRPMFKEGPETIWLTWEELSAPDGLLVCWLKNAVTGQCGLGEIEYLVGKDSLSGAIAIIRGTNEQASRLIDVLKRYWESLEEKGGAGPLKEVDITFWVKAVSFRS